MKICYITTGYQSHRRAGLNYIAALKGQGAHLVEDPNEAEIVIIHDEPQTLRFYYQAWPVLRRRYVIVYAVCETSIMAPNRLRPLGDVNEIWTSSTYCRTALAAAGRPVAVIPHIVSPIEADDAAAARLRSWFGLSADTFIFYTIAQLEERKNIEAGIRAFSNAVAAPDVRYIVKSTVPLPAEMRQLAGVINPMEYFSDDDIAALHRIGHCYVSPHCGEGWGLCMSDAMALGKLVIATGYSGNMDYMDAESALLARHSVEPIRQPASKARLDFDPSSTAPQWAYVDEADLGKLMVRARWFWDELKPMRDEARRRMVDYTPARVGDIMMRRLDAIAASLNLSTAAPG